MKIKYKVSDVIELEFESADDKDAFAQLSNIQQVFGENACGACGSTNLSFVVRTVESGKQSYEYFERRCGNMQCRARKSYGQSSNNNALFPRRKDADGNWLENNGWVIYDPKKAKENEEKPPF